jgi:hypothetical protein
LHSGCSDPWIAKWLKNVYTCETWETLKPLFAIHRDRSNREELDAAPMITNHREEEVLLLLYIPAILSLFLSTETIDLQKNETTQNKREKKR